MGPMKNCMGQHLLTGVSLTCMGPAGTAWGCLNEPQICAWHSNKNPKLEPLNPSRSGTYLLPGGGGMLGDASASRGRSGV